MKVTQEMIDALATLRELHHSVEVMTAFNVLDNAEVFAAIDDVTGYDVGSDKPSLDDPEQMRVSKCTCSHATGMDGSTPHNPGCPGDPEEWGDMAYTVNRRG